MTDRARTSTILRLAAALSPKDVAKKRDNLSAVVADGDRLWLGGDEGTAIHRMTRTATGDFDAHVRFDLKALLGLPGPAKEEIDIEGLDVDGGYLWLIGSHSAKRKKAESDKTDEENLARLATLIVEGNRITLARVPLDDSGAPVALHGALTAARLKGDTRSNLLTAALQAGPHVLEVTVRPEPDGTLGLLPLGPYGALYRKHFLQLDWLGIRDLVITDGSLPVLAGQTMDLDGPVYVYRWDGALSANAGSVPWNADFPKVVHVPFGVGEDHAEGLTLLSQEPPSVLVCYDTPAPSRLVDDGRAVRKDVFDLRA